MLFYRSAILEMPYFFHPDGEGDGLRIQEDKLYPNLWISCLFSGEGKFLYHLKAKSFNSLDHSTTNASYHSRAGAFVEAPEAVFSRTEPRFAGGPRRSQPSEPIDVAGLSAPAQHIPKDQLGLSCLNDPLKNCLLHSSITSREKIS
jgi:hypothetical protein